MEQIATASAEALATLGDSVSWGEKRYQEAIGALHTHLAQVIEQGAILKSARDQLYQLYTAVTTENEALKEHVSMLQSEIERLKAGPREMSEAELSQLLDTTPVDPNGVTPMPIPEKKR